MYLRPAQTRHERPGIATVELALLLPFLMFMFVITIDFARIFYFGVTIENCARNGAYFASNYPNASYLYNDIYGYKTLEEAVLKDAESIYDGKSASTKPRWKAEYSNTTSGPWATTTASTDKFVRMTVQWDFQSITRFPGVPTMVGLNRVVIMRMAPALPEF